MSDLHGAQSGSSRSSLQQHCTAALGVLRAWRRREELDAVLAAEPAMESLIGRLRSRSPAHPRGVALSRRLLRDWSSPLYEPEHRLALLHDVRHALEALDQPTGEATGRATTPRGARPPSLSLQ